jgi:membrane-bound inhibitor of C-type lysozyme
LWSPRVADANQDLQPSKRPTRTFVFQDTDGIRLEIAGQVLALARVPAASGAKYTDRAGNEFWTRDGALLQLAGQARRDCTVIPE